MIVIGKLKQLDTLKARVYTSRIGLFDIVFELPSAYL